MLSVTLVTADVSYIRRHVCIGCYAIIMFSLSRAALYADITILIFLSRHYRLLTPPLM